jgi:hypothetical protein
MTATEFRSNADKFTKAYVEAAMWSEPAEIQPHTDMSFTDHGMCIEDIADETLERMAADCAKFQEQCADLITVENCLTRIDCDEQAGHDFWFTRNGHGVGFWETYDWEKDAGEKLTVAAKRFKEARLYIGDDGRIYQS